MSIDSFDNKLKGDIGETAITLKLLRAGLNVFKPVGDRLPYDLLVEKDGTYKRIQCKYRKPTKYGHTQIKLSNRSGSSAVNYDKTTIDAIAVYCPETELIAFVNIEEIVYTELNLRFRQTKHIRDKSLYAAKLTNPLRIFESVRLPGFEPGLPANLAVSRV